MRFWHFLFVCAAVSAEVSVKTTTTHRRQFAATWLDMLRERYLDLEDSLWGVVGSGLEQSYVLQQVHSGHRTFLRDDFLENDCFLSTFDPDQRVIHEAVDKIDQMVSLTVDRYLHAARRLFNERDALQISLQNEQLQIELDKIHETTVTTDFYYTIKRVSLNFCVCMCLSQSISIALSLSFSQ